MREPLINSDTSSDDEIPKKTVPPTEGRNIGTGGINPATSRTLMEVYMVIVDCCVNYRYY
jgi:hypothetical protein